MNNTETTYHRQYQGFFAEKTERELKIEEFAKQYVDLTENYDKKVRSGPTRHGVIYPADGYEYSLVNKNARHIRERIKVDAATLGISIREIMGAVRCVRSRQSLI